VLALVSCGRLGFNDTSSVDGGDSDAMNGSGTESVRVVVMAEYASPGTGPALPPGPVESATVLVDRGAGALERLLTDAQGSVTLAADGLVAYHVVYGSSNAWRVYTVATGATGTVSLGGGGAPGAGGRVTIVLPSGSETTFHAHLPEHCQSIFEPSFTPSVSVQYNGACDGKDVPVIGFNSTNLNNMRYVDGGMVKLAPGARAMVAGTFAALPTHTIELTNVPAGAQFVSAEILARNQLDLMPLEFSSSATRTRVTGSTMMLTTTAATGGNTLRVTVDTGRAGRAVASGSTQIAPVNFSAAPISASFDALSLLPPFTSLDFDPDLNVTWVGGGDSGTMIVVHVSTDSFQWDAYLPSSATKVSFPVIPADIGFPRAPRVYTVGVMRIDVPGATAVGLTPVIDQAWRQWPRDPALFPASGNRIAAASFVSGLVADPSATDR
jgi:hypothetical protein